MWKSHQNTITVFAVKSIFFRQINVLTKEKMFRQIVLKVKPFLSRNFNVNRDWETQNLELKALRSQQERPLLAICELAAGKTERQGPTPPCGVLRNARRR